MCVCLSVCVFIQQAAGKIAPRPCHSPPPCAVAHSLNRRRIHEDTLLYAECILHTNEHPSYKRASLIQTSIPHTKEHPSYKGASLIQMSIPHTNEHPSYKSTVCPSKGNLCPSHLDSKTLVVMMRKNVCIF